MIIAGEASGDLHGSGLIREMKRLQPDLRFFGIGGPRMQEMGIELIYSIDEMSVVGFVEAIKSLPHHRKALGHLSRLMDERGPDLVILIDYPGFNLRLAKIAKQKGLKVLYYIPPQVWAWGGGRIKTIARYVDKVAVILDFEKEIYRRAGLDAEFVGHPIVEVLKTKWSREEFLKINGLNPEGKILGLLPGSRTQEIKRLLPEMLKTATAIRKEVRALQVLISVFPGVDLGLYRQLTDNSVRLIKDSTYELISYADLLLVASGTATLEAAYFGTPIIVVYKLSLLSWLLGKLVVKTKDIGLVNIVAGRRIVPEFVQWDFKAEKITPVALEILRDERRRDLLRRELLRVKDRLGGEGASRRTAQLAIQMLKKA